MKKFLLMLISLCGVLTACHRLPSKSDTYTPIDTVGPKTPPVPKVDSSRISTPTKANTNCCTVCGPPPSSKRKWQKTPSEMPKNSTGEQRSSKPKVCFGT